MTKWSLGIAKRSRAHHKLFNISCAHLQFWLGNSLYFLYISSFLLDTLSGFIIIFYNVNMVSFHFFLVFCTFKFKVFRFLFEEEKPSKARKLEVLISESVKNFKNPKYFHFASSFFGTHPIKSCSLRWKTSRKQKKFLILRLKTFFDKNKNTFYWSVVFKKIDVLVCEFIYQKINSHQKNFKIFFIQG